MTNDKTSTITVQGTAITILSQDSDDYISLTDMSKHFEGGPVLIEQWLRNKDTILFLGIWEQLHNPVFNTLEFEGISNESGRNSFTMSARKWIDRTRARGLVARLGRTGGTFAHRDIAFEFGSWISPEFKLYLIKEFERLKEDENRRLSLDWNLNRTLAKLNYRIHTDAIKAHIIPPTVTKEQEGYIYASEADLLNVALFGQTAKQWRDAHPDNDANMRDQATVEQLLVLTNLESMNAEFIGQGLPPSVRLTRLNAMAVRQLKSLTALPPVRKALQSGKNF